VKSAPIFDNLSPPHRWPASGERRERRAVVQVVGKVPPRRLAPHEALNRNSCRLRPGSVLAVRRSQFLKLQFHLIEEPLAPLGARVEQPKDRGP